MLKIIGIFLEVLFEFTHMILWLYTWLLLAAVVISWVNADPYNQIVRFIKTLTEPMLAPLRKKLIKLSYSTGLDFSALVAMFIIIFTDRIVMRILMPLAYKLEGG